MESEKLYDEILGIVKLVSTKALLILFENSAAWVPKSIVKNLDSIDLSNIEESQLFVIKKWFLDRKGLSNGY